MRWPKRGVTVRCVTRKRLNPSVLSWVFFDLSQIPHWCDALLDGANVLREACRAGVVPLDKFAEATVGIFSVAQMCQRALPGT